MPVQDRQIGMVFQGYALFKHLTVAENISFGPRMQDLDVDVDERHVFRLPAMQNLPPRHPCFLLSLPSWVL